MNEYLQELRRALPLLFRRRFVAELREHFASAAERGEDERVTIERLGPAHTLAAQLVADLRGGKLGRVAALLTGSRVAMVGTATAAVVVAAFVALGLLSVAHTSQHPSAAQRTVAAIALDQVGTPYTWGGASPATGFDSTGLVRWTYTRAGVRVPLHVRDLNPDVSRAKLQPGDLLYFDDHQLLGIYVGAGQYVDAEHTGSTVSVHSLASSAAQYDGAARLTK
ncbi:MAG TPA: NlpC/P60 family protein [Dehalococcoidia bacterium]|nr:NlpC/P60 family protein [Dehalococcoidia bacterium]